MPERVTRVSLRAVTADYIEGMRRAADETERTGTAAEKLAQQRQALETLGRTALGAGLALGAGVAVAIAKAAEFEQAMSNVNAITQETAENQTKLRDAALDAGGATIYTAREAANAEEELAKAGLATSQILGGALRGSLDLAASGQLEVARAAEITGITLKQYSLAGSEAGRVADVLSAGANKAVGSVEDLAQGLKFVGPQAAAMGVSLEDTVATLALFADQGIIGEQAGSALRGMLASLTAPSRQAQAALDDLDISLYDSNNRFVGLQSVVAQLNEKLGDADDATRDAALGVIFTNAQLTSAQALVGDAGKKWGEYRDAVDDSGLASRIAADRMDNLAGDVEKLGGAFDTALIKGGTGANEVLRGLVQGATDLVDTIGSLPEPVLGVGVGLAGVTAAALLAGGTFLTAVPKIAAFHAAMVTIRTEMPVAQAAMSRTASFLTGPWGIAIAAATLGLTALTKYLDSLKASSDEITASLSSAKSAADVFATAGRGASGSAPWVDVVEDLKDLDNVLQASADQYENVFARFDNSHFGAFDALKRVGTQLGEMAKTDLPSAQRAFNLLAEETDGSRTRLWQLLSNMPDFRDELIVLATTNGDYAETMSEAQKQQVLLNYAQKAGSDSASQQARELGILQGKAEDANDEIEGLADTIRGFASLTLNARAAEREFQAAIDDVTASVKEHGATLDRDTDAGRANEAALDALAKASLERSAAILDETGSQEQATQAIREGRDALIAQLAQFGIVGDEADAYADSLGLIPSSVDTVVKLKADAARADLQKLIDDFQNREISMSVALKGGASRADLQGRENGGMEVHAFESGGMPGGIYTGGPLYKFAEPNLPWEAFISPKPGHERENFGYALESMMRLSQQMGFSFGSVPQTSVDQSVHAPITVRASDPYVAAELTGQRIGSLLSVRR